MKKIAWTAAALVAAAFALGPSGAMAQAQRPMQAQQQQCDERTKVLGHLATKYQEAPVAIGVTSSGGLVEVLSTGDGNTWTIIVSNPNGVSCLLAAGEGWRAIHFDETAGDPRV
jgi:predicted alpha/beta-hydrolase family hydrolase